jgi:hypothetical protein
LQELDRVRVKYLAKHEVDKTADLIIQPAFSATAALRYAVDNRKPYIIMEEPHWRPDKEFCISTASWGYNGLAGRGWHPATPAQSRPKPKLMPLKFEGATIIFAQKPNDHSIDIEHNHVRWIKEQMRRFPNYELRHHPLMCADKQEPIAEALDRCYRAVTYSSTVGTEAVIAGCVSHPESPGSMAYDIGESREQWLHDLSWKQFTHAEYGTRDVANWIISGYEEARARADDGLIQTPRNKLDRNVECLRYYNEFGNKAAR